MEKFRMEIRNSINKIKDKLCLIFFITVQFLFIELYWAQAENEMSELPNVDSSYANSFLPFVLRINSIHVKMHYSINELIFSL